MKISPTASSILLMALPIAQVFSSNTNSALRGSRNLEVDTSVYEYVGIGQCFHRFDAIIFMDRTMDDCVALCEDRASYELPLVGFSLYNTTSNNYNGPLDISEIYEECFCYFDVVQELWTGDGSTDPEYECYQVKNFVQPSSSPTGVPTAAPSAAPTTSSYFTTLSELKDAVDDYLAGGTKQAAIEAERGLIEDWDTSRVTSFNNLFSVGRNLKASSFNADISGWQVGQVTSFTSTFKGATSFNADLSGWEMGNALKLKSMFMGAKSFNADITGWDVTQVTNIESMFYGAQQFNKDLTGWLGKFDIASIQYENVFKFSGCEVKTDPEQELVEGTDGYFCASVDGHSVLTKDELFVQAAKASQLCTAAYFQDDINVNQIDGFDSDKVDFVDSGDYAFDTQVVGRHENIVYLAFRGAWIEADDMGAITYYPQEMGIIEDSARAKPWLGAGSSCGIHGGLSDEAAALSPQWEAMLETQMDACEADYGYGNCELVLAAHSAGAALAMKEAGIYNIMNKDVRVLTFGGVPSTKDSAACHSLYNTDKIYNFVSYWQYDFVTTTHYDNDPVPFMTFNQDYKQLGRLIVFKDGSTSSVDWYDDATTVSDSTWSLPANINTISGYKVVEFLEDVHGFPFATNREFREAEMHRTTTYSDWFGSSGRTGVTINYY